ncbi:DUF1064 domain-containing protein [Fictibacillus gelatini]|uniref:DUF1064 domain-containing protein n=1 Tax=Fictibacillus gelatini TaxID=225985 RepID=UPI0004204B56|nr:DUF1064 domain-containing protein [Fictibacillus gelatini]
MSKYGAKKTVVDGIEFDSKLESQYYLYLKERQAKGEIEAFTLQPRYVLQEAFKKNGKTYRKIEYVADFEVVHPGGAVEAVDIKGVCTPDFAIKRKLFEKKYPYKLSVVKYIKKFGGWIELDELKQLRRKAKKVKS